MHTALRLGAVFWRLPIQCQHSLWRVEIPGYCVFSGSSFLCLCGFHSALVSLSAYTALVTIQLPQRTLILFLKVPQTRSRAQAAKRRLFKARVLLAFFCYFTFLYLVSFTICRFSTSRFFFPSLVFYWRNVDLVKLFVSCCLAAFRFVHSQIHLGHELQIRISSWRRDYGWTMTFASTSVAAYNWLVSREKIFSSPVLRRWIWKLGDVPCRRKSSGVLLRGKKFLVARPHLLCEGPIRE